MLIHLVQYLPESGTCLPETGALLAMTDQLMCQKHSAIDTSLLQMPDAADGANEKLEDSDFEVAVEDDDDVPLARKKQKSVRCGVPWSSTVPLALFHA